MSGSFWRDQPDVETFLEQVRGRILSAIDPASPYIRPVLQELLEGRGKMLRPAMVYAASFSGTAPDPQAVLEMAAAIEMLHMASLVHDDVIDNAVVRRGVPTVHAKAGVKNAVIAGDYLLTRAFSLLTTRNEQVDPAVVSRLICRLCDSEIDQDSEQWDFSISRSRYLRRIAGKTASLFTLSLYIGSAATAATTVDQFTLGKIGYLIGMAFQIQDDVLDYTGDTHTLGKPAGNDLREGVSTLPLIIALERDEEGALRRLIAPAAAVSGWRPGRLDRTLNMIRRSGGATEAAHIGDEYLASAIRSIDLLAIKYPDTSRILKSMIDRLAGRTY